MYSLSAKLKIIALAIALAFVVVAAKSIDHSELQSYPKSQIEFASSLTGDRPRNLQFLKYLLGSELYNKQSNPFDWEEEQRKRSYWKQCAFNAVSCFGKK